MSSLTSIVLIPMARLRDNVRPKQGRQRARASGDSELELDIYGVEQAGQRSTAA